MRMNDAPIFSFRFRHATEQAIFFEDAAEETHERNERDDY
jgi:hypothetical protein